MTADEMDTGAGPLVLVVEDEQQMRRFLRVTLRVHGYRVLEAMSAAEALVTVAARDPDLVVLDLGLPDEDGMAVVQKLRTRSSKPILVVSARHQEEDKVRALDLGADDYLTKPFGTSELLARIRVALRNASRASTTSDSGAFVLGDLRIDFVKREAYVRGLPVKLTPIEFRLLHALARSAGRVVTHRQLLADVWGEEHVGEAHYVRVYMSALRRKIEADPARPKLLLTEPSIGYRLQMD
jgi:two-component system KDP operon response regulator KdpE